MISAQTLRVCREGKPLHTFPDHAPSAQDAGRQSDGRDTTVKVKGYGPTESAARQDAVRAALQQTVNARVIAGVRFNDGIEVIQMPATHAA